MPHADFPDGPAFRQILDAVSDGIFIYDGEGTLLACNEMGRQMFDLIRAHEWERRDGAEPQRRNIRNTDNSLKLCSGHAENISLSCWNDARPAAGFALCLTAALQTHAQRPQVRCVKLFNQIADIGLRRRG
jgi:hypothetical protein